MERSGHPLGLPLDHLGGMPFLDTTFNPARLLAAIGAVRLVEAEQAGHASAQERTANAVEAWFDPDRIVLLRPPRTPMPAAPLSCGREGRLNAACDGLSGELPDWKPLMDLPVRYLRFSPANGAISASSRAWPQHILLADEAFTCDGVLREQVVHELAHQWFYLIQELWAVEITGGQALTLPSGTSNRSAAEVMGAAHVVAALLNMHATVGGAPEGRRDHLAWYGRGCLEVLETVTDDLTDAGRQIITRLEEAL